MIIANNILANFSNRQLGINTNNKAKSMEKLGSGYRINHASDDAAGLVISEKMRGQIRGLNQASQNTQDGISLLQTADGALDDVQNILQRMGELSVQSANDTYTDTDRLSINDEYTSLKKEINRISKQTEYNTQKILLDDGVSVGGAPDDIEIYTLDDGSYGGAVYKGVRYDWNQFLSEDGGSPLASAVPKEGDYYLNTVSGTTLHFSMDKGMDIPNISKKYDIQANESNIKIDDYTYNWNNIYDEDGVRFDKAQPKEGFYSLNHCGSEIQFYVFPDDSFHDVIERLNDSGAGSKTSWESEVDTNAIKAAVTNMNPEAYSYPIDNTSKGTKKEPLYTIYADTSGIQLDSFAKVSWSDLTFTPPAYNGANKGINFSTGQGIGDGTVINFTCPDSKVSFSFSISDEASLAEVIAGLNDTVIPTAINAPVDSQFTLNTISSPVMDSANVDGCDIPYYTQWHNIGMDFDSPYDSVTADSLSGLAITYAPKAPDVAGTSFSLGTSQMDNLKDFFKNGTDTTVQLTFNRLGDTISLSFGRTNNITDVNRPQASSYTTTADFDNAMNNYVNGLVTNFTNQFSASSLSLKSEGAAMSVNDFHEKNISSGNRSHAVLFDVKPKKVYPLNIQAGANSKQNIELYIDKISTAKLGILDDRVNTRALAESSIKDIHKATDIVSRQRAEIGASQNRLEKSLDNVQNTSENLQASESRLRDTDMADEMVKLSRYNIIEQATQSMLAQANQSTQGVLSLLQ